MGKERLLALHGRRIPYVKAFISSLDKGVLADEGTLKEGIVDQRSLVDDAVADNRVFHHCLGSNGDVRSDDRLANMSPILDAHRRTITDSIVSISR